VSQIHIVYSHPGGPSFTRDVLDVFRGGLADVGHTATVSDLDAQGFRSEPTAEEYARESGYHADAPVPQDVATEHARLDASDVWVFIYPVWWADCPARLKGWFDRVWTVGFAYKPARLRVARQALVLCTAGYPVADLEASGVYQAMRTVMLTDRIGDRAAASQFVVLGGTVARTDHPGQWAELRAAHLARVEDLARRL
jgi:NAD(P)H dehydrogenase (quinone)